jgi:hypothetical protein
MWLGVGDSFREGVERLHAPRLNVYNRAPRFESPSFCADQIEVCSKSVISLKTRAHCDCVYGKVARSTVQLQTAISYRGGSDDHLTNSVGDSADVACRHFLAKKPEARPKNKST